MSGERRHIRNIGEMFRLKVIEPEIRDGKRCKSCFERIEDEKTWYNGTQLCQRCKEGIKYGMG